MGKIKILVVEDEAVVAVDLCSMLDELGYETCESAVNYAEALELIEQEQPDLVLCDINLNGAKDGIDLASVIKEKYQLPIVFSTSYADPETVKRAVSTKPDGYLVKPFQKESLFSSVETALSSFGEKQKENAETFQIRDCLFVKTDRLYMKVQFDDILWLQSDSNYVKIYTETRRYMVRMSFRELLNKLPSDQFFQTHRSYYINLSRLNGINSTFVLVNNQEVPLSRSFKDQLMDRLNKAV